MENIEDNLSGVLLTYVKVLGFKDESNG